MKTLLCALAAVLCVTHLEAATIRIIGSPSWKIKKPDCVFKLDGAIQNLSPEGSTSGTLKMLLWATPAAFPSKGYVLAEHTFGQLDGGYQIGSFSKTETAYVPKISGNYNFTLSIVEYTGSGWLTRAFVTTGRKRLENGEFVTGGKWTIPNLPVIAPPTAVALNDQWVLTTKATENLNLIAAGTHAKPTVTVKKSGKAAITIAGDTSTALYTYTAGKSTLYDVKVPVARLLLDPTKTNGSTKLTLFFQSATAGVYKSVQEDSSGGSTTWGLFTYKRPTS